MNKIKVFIAPTKYFSSSLNYPVNLEKELSEISLDSLKKQKFAVWGLTSYAINKFFSIDFDSSKVVRNEFGKPVCLDNNINFSYSHKNDLIAVAVGCEGVGVDIEKIDLSRVNDGLINRVLTDAEKEELSKAEDLFLFWTKKEAIFKLNGNSSQFSPKLIDTTSKFTVSNTLFYNGEKYYLSVAANSKIELEIEVVSSEIILS